MAGTVMEHPSGNGVIIQIGHDRIEMVDAVPGHPWVRATVSGELFGTPFMGTVSKLLS
ncbi:hypothetical protein [Nonomuraea typhae]|uniref:SH3 domain-containing protein n=1 Tax=Nonomuraea typhae TaxID=2603600 RepID=A0ABW7ZCK4_9ACTN